VHPLERLRFVARSADPVGPWVVQEAAVALAELAEAGGSVVLACRQLCSMLPENGALWSLACWVLAADDPAEAAWGVVLGVDDVGEEGLAGGIVDLGAPSGSVVQALLAGPDGVVVERPGRALTPGSSTPTKRALVGPMRLLPRALFEPLAARLGSGRPTPSGRRCRVLPVTELAEVVVHAALLPGDALAEAAPDCEALADVVGWAAGLV